MNLALVDLLRIKTMPFWKKLSEIGTTQLEIDHKTVLTHLNKAGYTKKLNTWDPHELTERNLMNRVHICDSLLKRNEMEPFSKRLITVKNLSSNEPLGRARRARRGAALIDLCPRPQSKQIVFYKMYPARRGRGCADSSMSSRHGDAERGAVRFLVTPSTLLIKINLAIKKILKSTDVNSINHAIQKEIAGDSVTYQSIDSVMNADEVVNYPIELLNSSDLPGVPPHKLSLKKDVPIILLQNVNASRFCNRLRLVVKKLMSNVIEATSGKSKGEDVFIPLIRIIPTDLPFDFQRLHLPIRLALSIIINKARRPRLITSSVRVESRKATLFPWPVVICCMLTNRGDGDLAQAHAECSPRRPRTCALYANGGSQVVRVGRFDRDGTVCRWVSTHDYLRYEPHPLIIDRTAA
ncbi:Histone-lysine N-methyltransferase SETMAR [Eumeta japonica]|uniref:Histone-lysine N-methyltransferase SETMAR n=1 Tax=Eumeta variegata TaxID=151549 RepID=A0A4C1WX02_EUMVA|nr:Histone-lysine N-methyltransferase SETMAR [Eumeta japonica]